MGPNDSGTQLFINADEMKRHLFDSTDLITYLPTQKQVIYPNIYGDPKQGAF